MIRYENQTLNVYGTEIYIYGLADVESLLAEARSVLEQRVALAGVPSAIKDWLTGITPEMWGALGFEGRRRVLALMVADQSADVTSPFTIEDKFDYGFWVSIDMTLLPMSVIFEDSVKLIKKKIDTIKGTILEGAGEDSNKEQALEVIKVAVENTNKIPEGDTIPLIAKVAEALKEPHAFNIYAKDSVNFGVLLNYRQKWDPQTYQVGELINTIPLAPKEVRKYTKKQTFKESRKRKEVNNALSVRRGDTSQTGRSETEIVKRANEKTAFNASANANGSIGVVNFGGSTSLDVDSAKDSARTKKNFREAVTKSAQELKNEQKLEVELTTSSDIEDTMTGEISNPNEEIPVTYLFYELQRRFKVYEYLHNATPVILVANDVPNPDEIDEAWLLRYEWILRRSILDDDFLKAFSLLKKARSGKNIETDTLRTHVEQQLRAFQDTKTELETYTKTRTASERELRASVEKYADAVSAEKSTIEEIGDVAREYLSPLGVFGSVQKFFSGIGKSDIDNDTAESSEGAQARQEAVEEALARIDHSITDTRTRLQGISTALDQAIDKYMTAVRTRLDGELALMKLRVHVKDNILYYMQAIWDHEPTDQRFFRLCDILVPMFKDPEVELSILEAVENSNNLFFNMVVASKIKVDNNSNDLADFKQLMLDECYVTLKEMADLDNLLGYKGNYMIFPLIAAHPLTDFMMLDYLDDEYGKIKDPDKSIQTMLRGQTGTRIWKQFEAKVKTEMRKESEDQIQDFRRELLKNESSNEIVVPSDLLFIAALTDTHPILEDFKLKHRGIDVLKAAAELEEQQVELIRRKARLLGKNLKDPEIDKRVIIQGNSNAVPPASDVGTHEVVTETDDGNITEVEPADEE